MDGSANHGQVVSLFSAGRTRANPGRPVRVTVVDDQFVGRRMLEAMLRGLQWAVEVESFADPVRALEAIRQSPPDLLITDYRMPGMAGAELVRRFRATPGCEDVPVLVVTVAKERRVRYEALEAGANDFLLRPLDQREILSRCNNLLQIRFGRLLGEANHRAGTRSGPVERERRPAGAAGRGPDGGC